MSHLLRKAALSAIGGSLLVATLGLAPAAADKPDTPPGQARQERASDHDGDADSSSSTSYTEDDDTNDGGTPNNVADDGDNRHPSGRDRSVEHGGGNQGRSESDPDDDGRGPDRSNGGADKPNGPGGEDLADQDGNNGCGNDDDFEDDNEGWCGRKPAKPATPEHAATPEHEAQPCAGGSMEHPCGATPEATPEHTPAKPCPNGSMTRPCHAAPVTHIDDDDDDDDEAAAAGDSDDDTEAPAPTADSAEHHVGGAAGFSCPAAGDVDDDMSVRCERLAADDDDSEGTEDRGERGDTQVLGMESSRGGAAAAEAPASTVSARSAGAGVLASLPLVGSVIQGQLPFTGISTLSFLIVAMAAMVIGFLLVRASRKAGATS